MQKMLKHKNITTVLIIVLAFLVLLSVGGIVYGAYTHSLHAQRVIAPYELGERFSSNYLLKVENSENNARIIYTNNADATDGTDPVAILTICNYPQGKQTQPNANNITYTLDIKFKKFNEGTHAFVDASTSDVGNIYTVKLKNGNGSQTLVTLNNSSVSSTINGSLTGGAANSNVYLLEFSRNFAAATTKPNLYVELTATPSDSGLPTLKGLFSADERIEGSVNSWTGSFSDDDRTDPYHYDGYNYVITGFGEGTCTLTWDETLVSISYISLSELLAITGATYNGTNSITFNVNSSDTNRYELQFYNIGITDNTTTWSLMSSSVVRFNYR